MKLKLLYRILFLFLILNYQNSRSQDATENRNYQKEVLIIESLPKDLPSNFSLPISYLGEVMTLELEKSSVFGKHTKFLVDDGTGKLVQAVNIEECTYTGSVKEHSEFYVNAVISQDGLTATIIKSKTEKIEIKYSPEGNGLHEIYTTQNEGASYIMNCPLHGDHEDHESASIYKDRASETQIAKVYTGKKSLQHKEGAVQAATLPPTTVMDVLEYEIGVEIGSRSFLGGAYNGNLTTAQNSAQSIIGNLNRRFLHGSGVKFTLGTVIIRTNANTDPLRNSVTATGTASNAGASLSAFRNYWNSHPAEVGTTHDVAVYHVQSSPSGLAYVNRVATSDRYATMGGNGATSWADGTAVHEVGHVWNLRHTGSSGIFYENRPRIDSGSSSTGGREYGISVMHGSGNNNIGRFSTTEAQVVRQVLNNKRSFGVLTSNPGAVRPFGVYDEYDLQSSLPIVLDVVANDYDMNNDILDVRLLDNVSTKGGTISLSSGTGPGGRNEIIYTPPASGFTGKDFFHYTVFDTTGMTDFGAVYIESTVSLFNENSDVFRFDFGTKTSPVWPDYDRVYEKTDKDLYGWTNTADIFSIDRGALSGANNLNKDLCYSSQTRVFETKLRNGKWQVIITFGDTFPHDNMIVKAEGETKLANVTRASLAYANEIFEVDVYDGKLSLEFSDGGGTDQNWVINRVILTYMGALSVDGNELEDILFVYPNPTDAILNVKIEDDRNWELSILDMLGNTMYENSKDTSSVSNEVTVNVDSWSQGVYFVMLKIDNKRVVKKVIVQ